MSQQEETPGVPVFQESMAGALIDSARISVMAALAILPPRDVPLIMLPGDEDADDAASSAEGCLAQAMQWLDAARVHTIAAGAPVTSLHVARR